MSYDLCACASLLGWLKGLAAVGRLVCVCLVDLYSLLFRQVCVGVADDYVMFPVCGFD